MGDRDGRRRRQYPRVPLDAWVLISQHGSAKSYTGKNVSAGGVFVLADEAPPVESEVELDFVVAGSSLGLESDEDFKLEARGVVVRDNTHVQRHNLRGFAVEFRHMPSKQREQLSRIVRAIEAYLRLT